MSNEIELAERRLGRAALRLDDVVREHRRERRMDGAREGSVMAGVHEDRVAAFEEVDEAMRYLRGVMSDDRR